MKGILFLLLLASSSSIYADIDASFDVIPDFMYENLGPKQDDLIQVHSVEYTVNQKATYCKRPTDMIDTIVVHHSETRNNETPLDINRYHLNRGSASDPWYMIAYSYVLTAPYEGATTPLAKAYVGRPINIVGAHAGSNIFVPMDDTQKKLWANKKIVCGNDRLGFKYDSSLVKSGKIKANVTTIGIVVIGNYAEFSGEYIRVRGKTKKNPVPNLNGFLPAKEPTDKLIDMYARLSCQLQKEYPRIKTLAYHNQYHSTSCPGTIQEKEHMNAIKAKAKEYGCDFTVMPRKYY